MVPLNDEVEPGHGADLRLDRLAQRIPVEEPGGCDQADHHDAERRRHRHPRDALSLWPWSMTNPSLAETDVRSNRCPIDAAGVPLGEQGPDPRPTTATCWVFSDAFKAVGGCEPLPPRSRAFLSE